MAHWHLLAVVSVATATAEGGAGGTTWARQQMRTTNDSLGASDVNSVNTTGASTASASASASARDGAAAAVRHVQSFDYGWRFHFGDEPGSCPGPGTCAFETDIGAFTCTGMEHNPNRFSVEDCRMACCYSAHCLAWQYNNAESGKCLPGEAGCCSHGGGPTSRDFECLPATGARNQTADGGRGAAPCVLPPGTAAADGGRGGQRARVPAPKRDWAFAAPRLASDATWDIVDLPHDFVIANATISSRADKFHGHFQRNVSRQRASAPPLRFLSIVRGRPRT